MTLSRVRPSDWGRGAGHGSGAEMDGRLIRGDRARGPGWGGAVVPPHGQDRGVLPHPLGWALGGERGSPAGNPAPHGPSECPRHCLWHKYPSLYPASWTRLQVPPLS